jgi:hypothetical protein
MWPVKPSAPAYADELNQHCLFDHDPIRFDHQVLEWLTMVYLNHYLMPTHMHATLVLYVPHNVQIICNGNDV